MTDSRNITLHIGGSTTPIVDGSPISDSVSLRERHVLAAANTKLRDRADVIDIRMGYVFKNGWITNERALVVAVFEKQSLADLSESSIAPLPKSFLGFPVEVTNPSIEDLIRFTRGPAVATAAFRPPAPRTMEIANESRKGISVKRVTDTMRVCARVSPDTGCPELSGFIKNVKKTLTVAMYGFGAAPTVTAVAGSSHIKVAIRDSSALWLSSGKCQSWHAVIEHGDLARMYEAFIKSENDTNHVNPVEALPFPDVLVPKDFFAAAEPLRKFKYLAPFDETRQFTVTPLLTSDNYHEKIIDLIEGARSELLIQNQTFNAPRESDVKLKALVDAVMRRIDAGVDVRVICRFLMPKDARDNLSELKDYGFPTARIKVRQQCRAQGIIVDRKRVLLGTQNWSNAGVSVNRDASLLIDDEPLAEYFRAVFEHDWKYQATQNIGPERGGIRIASRDEQAPAGMERLKPKDYTEFSSDLKWMRVAAGKRSLALRVPRFRFRR